MTSLPFLIPFVADLAEHYLTLHRVHPSRTYNYVARNFRDLPVIEAERHAAKCKQGDSWMYVAVPTAAKIESLGADEKLYVGAQTQDRMFRGDDVPTENFHHKEMRAGNGTDNLVSFLRSGRAVAVYRFEASRLCERVNASLKLRGLLPLVDQPLTVMRHRGWWFEQYMLYREFEHWRWNTDPAAKVLRQIMGAAS